MMNDNYEVFFKNLNPQNKELFMKLNKTELNNFLSQYALMKKLNSLNRKQREDIIKSIDFHLKKKNKNTVVIDEKKCMARTKKLLQCQRNMIYGEYCTKHNEKIIKNSKLDYGRIDEKYICPKKTFGIINDELLNNYTNNSVINVSLKVVNRVKYYISDDNHIYTFDKPTRLIGYEKNGHHYYLDDLYKELIEYTFKNFWDEKIYLLTNMKIINKLKETINPHDILYFIENNHIYKEFNTNSLDELMNKTNEDYLNKTTMQNILEGLNNKHFNINAFNIYLKANDCDYDIKFLIDYFNNNKTVNYIIHKLVIQYL